MRTREQAIWDFVQDWLKKAFQDLKSAEILIKEHWEDYFNCAFHAQQAAEKLIKAYLVKNQIEFRKIHNLGELIDLVEKGDKILTEKLRFSEWLTDFAVKFRYPGEPPVEKETAEMAIADAQRVKEIILDALEDYLSQGYPGGKEDV